VIEVSEDRLWVIRVDRFKGFAEDCMAEYNLVGCKVPDLTDPGELSYHMLRK
jgi:4-hydroxyphenylacetate 3-monooxygenase